MRKDFASQHKGCVTLMGTIQRELKGLMALYALYRTQSDYSMENSLGRERNQNDSRGIESRYSYLFMLSSIQNSLPLSF